MAKRFEVRWDAHDEYFLVREVSYAFAQSQVPADFQCQFETKAQAVEQVRRLAKWQEKGNEVKTKNMWTDALFEAVADTKYGCAW